MDHNLVVAKELAYINEAMSHAMQIHPRVRVIVESSEKSCLLEEEMATHFSIRALRTP